MRRLLLLLPLSLMVTCYTNANVHAQSYGAPPSYPPGQQPPPPPAYRGPPGPYAHNPTPGPENCGTPDEPKPCPPMPRVPLQYFPANHP
jgi:hypothetical protein